MPVIDEGRWSGEHSPRSSFRRVVSSSAAAIGSVVMHALLALPAVWVESAPKVRRPDQMGAGSSAIASVEEPTETLILVNIPGVTRSAERDPVSLASRGFAPRDLLISLASPDVAPAVDLNRVVVTEDGEIARDPAVVPVGRRAQLLGLYVGQVKARIERAWLRPRSGIVGSVFTCSVTIRQDSHGRIEKVALHACNGSDEWQRSLELARAYPGFCGRGIT